MTVVALSAWASSVLWFFGGVAVAGVVVGGFSLLKAKRQREYQRELEGRGEGGSGGHGRQGPGT